ncbi:MAG: helix-turn-helix domain-containing protein [Clostridiales bacterium]|nr:helix-turn-helix domain-containing protein [Clostridiales bacterium]
MGKIEIPGFGDRLKGVLEERGMTRAECAEECETSEANIKNWTSGKKFPNSGNLAILCETLNVSADYLLFGRERGT